LKATFSTDLSMVSFIQYNTTNTETKCACLQNTFICIQTFFNDHVFILQKCHQSNRKFCSRPENTVFQTQTHLLTTIKWETLQHFWLQHTEVHC